MRKPKHKPRKDQGVLTMDKIQAVAAGRQMGKTKTLNDMFKEVYGSRMLNMPDANNLLSRMDVFEESPEEKRMRLVQEQFNREVEELLNEDD